MFFKYEVRAQARISHGPKCAEDDARTEEEDERRGKKKELEEE